MKGCKVKFVRLYSRQGPKSSKKFLPLDEFIFRSQVISTYRDFLRKVYKSPQKHEIINFVKPEFKVDIASKEIEQRKYMLAEGKKRMEHFIQMMELQA